MILLEIIISIYAFACAAWLLRKIFSVKMCPICVGVAGTWLWIVFGMYAGLLDSESWKLPAAILMGGSAVGIAYQLEKKISGNPLLWKALFVPAAFSFAYGVLMKQGSVAVVSFAFLLFVLFLFLLLREKTGRSKDAVKELERKMEQCC